MSDEITNLMQREGLTFPQAVENLATGALKGRERLLNRRRSELFSFVHDGFRFSASVSRFSDGRVAEIFISADKTGAAIEALARDAAILLSLLFQHGADPVAITHALTKNDAGGAASLIGAAAAALAQEEPAG